MRKPINVLTGMDYWLDNLMCNVPEMAMCYHLNGIVQVKAVHLVLQTRNWVRVCHGFFSIYQLLSEVSLFNK